MEAHVGQHYSWHSFWSLLQGCQQALEHVCQDPKGVLPNYEVWHVLVILGQWLSCWKAYGVVVDAAPQLRVIEDVGIAADPMLPTSIHENLYSMSTSAIRMIEYNCL